MELVSPPVTYSIVFLCKYYHKTDTYTYRWVASRPSILPIELQNHKLNIIKWLASCHWSKNF